MTVILPTHKKGPIPFLMYGYGGFGVSVTPKFRLFHRLWLEAGGGLAFPNIRGGGENGQAWHLSATLENKQRSFDDFTAAAEYLIRNELTTSEKLAIWGRSNGGLLVAAVAIQRPELFAAVLCAMPLSDMLRYHLFGLGYLWMAEYGNPNQTEMFSVLRAYSPYHNIVKSRVYPSMLIVGAENDVRNDPIHALKLAAQLIWAGRHRAGSNKTFLDIRQEGGHLTDLGLDLRARYDSYSYAYLMKQLGLFPLK